ncbi:hypothetical protein DdX_20614 [Ditylenchus destructor]|uniref:Uncharacterized protein n=1 Tax=Ditylenchus destructor TaxID=166010 RepID=A0AAD4MGZ2_9BILA|nr:hypothetical protein DdX_20614 [Ditylenchus destructor]
MVIGPAQKRLKDYLQDAKVLLDHYNADNEYFLVNVRSLKTLISRALQDSWESQLVADWLNDSGKDWQRRALFASIPRPEVH